MRESIRRLISTALIFLLAAGSVQAAGSAGMDTSANVSGLSSPAWTSPTFLPFFSGANATNDTTASDPIILPSAIFGQEMAILQWQNGSGYFHPILSKWDQVGFYLPMPGYEEFFGGYSKEGATANASQQAGAGQALGEYSTTSIRQFATQDAYYPGIEEHDDPDRMELYHFLEDDEPPERSLL